MADIQRAAFSKRIFAFLADIVIGGLLLTGLYMLMSTVLNIDKYSEKYKAVRTSYEEQYGVTFGLDRESFEKLTEEEKKVYTDAVDAMNGDGEANKAIRTAYRLSFGIFAAGIVVTTLLLEFIVPLFTKDGRTPGKLLFGLGVMRKNCLRMSAPVSFVRGVIGKGVFELALPAVIIVTVFSNVTGIFGIIMLAVFLILETVALVKSGGSSALHDVLADTVVIDWHSQMIFNTVEEREAFELERKKITEEEYIN